MKATILLIEDNEQNRYLTTFLLEQHGHAVIAAPDGPQGIELAQRHSPHLILLDIQLPTMDGYSVARRLRTLASLQGVPIIAVTFLCHGRRPRGRPGRRLQWVSGEAH